MRGAPAISRRTRGRLVVIANACGEEASSRGTDSSVHIESPAGRNRGRGCAGIASAGAEPTSPPPRILPLSTYFCATSHLLFENRKNLHFWHCKPTLIFFCELGPLHGVACHKPGHLPHFWHPWSPDRDLKFLFCSFPDLGTRLLTFLTMRVCGLAFFVEW